MTVTEYVPTLLQYAEVIEWLREEVRYCDRRPVPDNLKRAYDDAIERAGLGRIAKAMQDAEDAAATGVDSDWYGYGELTVERLTVAFLAAQLAAALAQPGDDGGSANFDSAFLYARRGLTAAKVEAAADAAGIEVRRWNGRHWNGWMIAVGAGQGAMRTRMAEAARDALDDAGLEASVYYQLD